MDFYHGIYDVVMQVLIRVLAAPPRLWGRLWDSVEYLSVVEAREQIVGKRYLYKDPTGG